jgi:hypothetical protein
MKIRLLSFSMPSETAAMLIMHIKMHTLFEGILNITRVQNRFFIWTAFEPCKRVNIIFESLKAL